ncbi:MAG TPA: hypothetical protein PKV27_08435, partial [Ilumatobacteraceae bacterium]|nr:hypothetical protein [Ilumatobacteraceae bacterium]
HQFNHGGSIARWARSAAELGRLGFGDARPARDRHIAGAVDAAAVAALIDERTDRPNTLLAIHHPLRSNSTHPWFQTAGADELLAVLTAQPHVRAVLSGHTHEALELTVHGVRLISGPSSWYSIGHHGDVWTKGEGRAGVQLLDLHPDGRIDVTALPHNAAL